MSLRFITKNLKGYLKFWFSLSKRWKPNAPFQRNGESIRWSFSDSFFDRHGPERGKRAHNCLCITLIDIFMHFFPNSRFGNSGKRRGRRQAIVSPWFVSLLQNFNTFTFFQQKNEVIRVVVSSKIWPSVITSSRSSGGELEKKAQFLVQEVGSVKPG